MLDRRAPVSRLSSFAPETFESERSVSSIQCSASFDEADHYDPIAAALKEDIGEGDITTDFFVPETLHATGRITSREKAIVAGIGAAAEVFRRVDSSIDIQIIRRDGDEVVAGDIILEVRVLARSILRAERVALNFLQRLCGIATLTRQFVDAIGNHSAKILDTRKTTPGLRGIRKGRSGCRRWC